MKCIDSILVLDGGTGFSTYEWRHESLEIAGNSQTLEVSTTGDYTLIVNNADGCIASHLIAASDYSPVNLDSFEEIVVRCESSIVLGTDLAADNPGATPTQENLKEC